MLSFICGGHVYVGISMHLHMCTCKSPKLMPAVILYLLRQSLSLKLLLTDSSLSS